MKLTDAISQIRTDNKVEVKKTRKAEGDPGVAGLVAADKVELSSNSRDVQKMQEILAQTPEMRMEMIESLKKEIDAGTYQIDSREIANKMMNELLSDEEIIRH